MYQHYANFSLLIQPHNGDVFEVSATGPDDASADAELGLPITDSTFQRNVAQLRRNAADEALVAQVGRQLFDALFSGAVLRLYRDSRRMLSPDTGLRVRLVFRDGARAAEALPWELLSDPDTGPLVLRDTPLLRYLPAPLEPISSAALETPLKVLLTAASPQQMLDVSDMLRALEAGLAELGDRVAVTVEPHVTIGKLQQLLRGGFHGWCFVGASTVERGPGALVFEDEAGDQARVSARQLAGLLNRTGLRLVVANTFSDSDWPPDSSPATAISGLASALVLSRVPAILGTQFAMMPQAATAFARELCRTLLDGYPIDVCVTEGRKAIATVVGAGRPDWAGPIAYTCVPDGRLFATARPLPPETSYQSNQPPAPTKSQAPRRQQPKRDQSQQLDIPAGLTSDDLREARYLLQSAHEPSYGRQRDLANLSEGGWGAIFAEGSSPAIKEALGELLKHRSYRDLTYHPGETTRAFLARYGVNTGPIDPQQVPYYLLIVGDPESIPFEFQYQLDLQYAVGRISFDTVEAYARYAHSVVLAEAGEAATQRRAVLFGPQVPDDPINDSVDRLMTAAYQRLSADKAGWQIDRLFGGEATKAQLSRLLDGADPLALLFAAGQSVTFPSGHQQQLAHQGALVCSNWSGPAAGRGPLTEDVYFSADDLGRDTRLLGLIAVLFADCSAGTPRWDDRAGDSGAEDQRHQLAPQAFVACLPQRLLGHPGGGALAVIGHVGPTAGYQLARAPSQAPELFAGMLQQLIRGTPIGVAMEPLSARYAELAVSLTQELEEIRFGKNTDAAALAQLQLEMVSARNWVVFGDPAVRVQAARDNGYPPARPDQYARSAPQTPLQALVPVSSADPGYANSVQQMPVQAAVEPAVLGAAEEASAAYANSAPQTPLQAPVPVSSADPGYANSVQQMPIQAAVEPAAREAAEDAPAEAADAHTTPQTLLQAPVLAPPAEPAVLGAAEDAPAEAATATPPPNATGDGAAPTAPVVQAPTLGGDLPPPPDEPPDEPRPEQNRRRRSPEATEEGPPPSRQVIETMLLPYQPPPAEHTITITVGARTITLEYRDIEYSSQNAIDRKALLRAARAEQYGQALFKGIINDQTSAAGLSSQTTRIGYHTALNDSNRELRIELEIDPNDLELHALKWEYLRSPDDSRPLAAYERRPLFRRLPGPPPRQAVPARPLKILVAICNPTTLGKEGNTYLQKLAPLDIAQERAIVESGLARLKTAGLADYRVMAGDSAAVTQAALLKELQDGYHILHIIAHGLRIEGEYFLVMEDESRADDLVSAPEFELMLPPDLRLVVLAACQSAIFGVGEALQGLGPRLVRAGVPAVIAMQDLAPIDMAQFFAQHFYDDLARSGRVDMAMAATRLALCQWAGVESWSWGIPALLMGSAEGLLFAIDTARAARLDELKPDIKDYNTLAGQGDPAPRRMAYALQDAALAHGASPSMLNTLRTLGAMPQAATSPAEQEALAPRQDRLALSRLLRRKVALDPAGLRRYVENEGHRLKLPVSVYQQVASALNAGKHIIFIGPPGTGKTSFAHDVCDYAVNQGFAAGVMPTTATADWSTFDTIGGYVPTPTQTLQFRPGIFVRAICMGSWLVIDEINRAEIDKAFGELFTSLAGQQVDLPYTVGDQPVRLLPAADADARGEDVQGWVPPEAKSGYDYVLHPSWRILAAMNVYDKSYLFAMSFAFMRRFAFIDLDVPSRDDYQNLIGRWLKQALPETTDPAALLETFRRLLDREAVLMRRRTLGPAIVKDIVAYIGERHQQDAAETLANLLCEACLLYAVPQFDGLDQEGIRDIYHYLENLFDAGITRASMLARIRLLYPHLPMDFWAAPTSNP